MKTYSYINTLAKNNEDAIIENSDFIGILDGATGLFGKNITDFETDAKWLSNNLRDYLMLNLSNKKLSLSQIVSNGIIQMKENFKSFSTDFNDFPSCSCAIIRKNEENFEYLVMADSPILIKYKSGSFEEIVEEKLKELDEIALNQAISIAKEKNISVIDARPYITEILQKHRKLLNTKNGYHAISTDENAPFDAIIGTIPCDKVEKIMVMSDGFSQYYDTLFIANSFEEFDKKTDDLEKMYHQIIFSQKEDENCNKYPRLKLSDDASIVVATI